MKYKNIMTNVVAALFTVALASAQVSEDAAMTTTSKTVTINKGDEIFKRTVEVSTMESENTRLYNMKEGKKTDEMKPIITKMVKIDNDRDDAFDEKIVFSYRAYAPQDFVLISDAEEMMVAVDNGKELTVEQDMRLTSKKGDKGIETYVFTDKNGKEVEFMVKEHIRQWEASSDYR